MFFENHLVRNFEEIVSKNICSQALRIMKYVASLATR